MQSSLFSQLHVSNMQFWEIRRQEVRYLCLLGSLLLIELSHQHPSNPAQGLDLRLPSGSHPVRNFDERGLQDVAWDSC